MESHGFADRFRFNYDPFVEKYPVDDGCKFDSMESTIHLFFVWVGALSISNNGESVFSEIDLWC